MSRAEFQVIDEATTVDAVEAMLAAKKAEKEKRQAANEARRIQGPLPFPLAYRGVEAEDLPFILNAWVLSYRDFKRDHKNSDYFPGQQNLIAELAKRRNMVVACDGDTPSFIVGFCCGITLADGRLLVDYVYVKQAYREHGIGRGMLAELGWRNGMEIVATHWTRTIDKLARRYNAGLNAFFNTIGYSEV